MESTINIPDEHVDQLATEWREHIQDTTSPAAAAFIALRGAFVAEAEAE